MLLFSCLMKVLPLDFFPPFFPLLLFSSSRQRLAPISRGPSACWWGFLSSALCQQSTCGGREGRMTVYSHPGMHFKWSLLFSFFFFPWKDSFCHCCCCWPTVFIGVFYVDSSNSHPIASSELWQIKLCLHQTCFLYPQIYLKHFF